MIEKKQKTTKYRISGVKLVNINDNDYRKLGTYILNYLKIFSVLLKSSHWTLMVGLYCLMKSASRIGSSILLLFLASTVTSGSI